MTQKNTRPIPIGIDDFGKLIEGGYYFADKSLLIKEFLDSGAEVTLIPRPRRFGKTLNLSMVRYFFEKVETSIQESRRHLFKGLKIEQHTDCMVHQGKYPVIWMTFKDVKADKWLHCYEKICQVISVEFKQQFEVIKPFLSALETQQVQQIIAGTASQVSYENALLNLSHYLERAHKTRVIILIDEYDAPIHAGYLNGYYSEVVGFMRGFMCAGLKGNPALRSGLLTGILRVAQPSLAGVITSKHELSYGGQASPPTNCLGIDHLEVRTFLQQDYSDKFGFLEPEVDALLAHYNLGEYLGEVRRWYDGYQSGEQKIYNPWSIINFADNNGKIQAYWVNTSDNALIKDLLRTSSVHMKEELEIIAKGGTVTKTLQENIVLTDLENNDDALWNFLLFCGYLTFANNRLAGRSRVAEFGVPNEEVMQVYETSFKNWFESGVGRDEFQRMLTSLIDGNPESFKKSFERFSQSTLSYFDVQGDSPELFYHALVLGMLASLSSSHEVRSNRESGYGRYDVLFIPKNRDKAGIVLEFKAVDLAAKETLESAARDALKQIEKNSYETELRALGVRTILKLGISFKGKQSLVLVG